MLHAGPDAAAMMWLKRLWWRVTGKPTLARYGQEVTITRRMGLFRVGTDPARVNTLMPTDLNTPDSREALDQLTRRG